MVNGRNNRVFYAVKTLCLSELLDLRQCRRSWGCNGCNCIPKHIFLE